MLERVAPDRVIPDLWTLTFHLPNDESRTRCFQAVVDLATSVPIWNLHRRLSFEQLPYCDRTDRLDVSRVMRPAPPRLGLPAQVGLVVRIWTAFVRARWTTYRHPLPAAVTRLGEPGRPPRYRVEPRRLGGIVARVLRFGPWKARCLWTALVMYGLAARPGRCGRTGDRPSAGAEGHHRPRVGGDRPDGRRALRPGGVDTRSWPDTPDLGPLGSPHHRERKACTEARSLAHPNSESSRFSPSRRSRRRSYRTPSSRCGGSLSQRRRTGVVDAGPHGIVEVRLVSPVQDRIGNPPPEQPPDERLASGIGELHLRRKAEEELPQIDVCPRASAHEAAQLLTGVIGFHREADAGEGAELQPWPIAARAGTMLLTADSLTRLRSSHPGTFVRDRAHR